MIIIIIIDISFELNMAACRIQYARNIVQVTA